MANIALQVFSHYPSHPPPVRVSLFESGPSTCPYHAGRVMRTRAFFIRSLNGEIYHDFMDAGFRRSGEVFYQPTCPGCRECIPIRVNTSTFAPTKSQRRAVRKNQDLQLSIVTPHLTDEKYQIYQRYLAARHERSDTSFEDMESFLYRSPVDSLEFEYRTADNRLVGISLLDVCSKSFSSVYMFFDPVESKRSLGVYSAIREIWWAKEHQIPYYYLGYWVQSSPAMRYKADYQPNEKLRTDGLWSQ